MQTLFHYMVTRRRQLVNVCLFTVLALKHGSQRPKDLPAVQPTVSSLFTKIEHLSQIGMRYSIQTYFVLFVLAKQELLMSSLLSPSRHDGNKHAL